MKDLKKFFPEEMRNGVIQRFKKAKTATSFQLNCLSTYNVNSALFAIAL